MATATAPVDAEALRLERDRRFDAGETTAAIDADFRTRGIDPRTLRAVGRPRTADDTRAATGRQPDAEPATAGRTAPPRSKADEAVLSALNASLRSLTPRTPAETILDERLRSAVTRGRVVVEPDGREGMAHDNHPDFYRWESIVRRIACETYGELAARLWDQMGSEVVAWASRLDSRGIAR